MWLNKFWLCAALLFLFGNSIAAQTVALSDDPNFIKSSILITSVGALPHQIVGHAAIRMVCEEQNLDRVFTFNNNNADDFSKMLTQNSVGEVLEVDTKYYIEDARRENRGVTGYPLNLTLNQKARLWEVLDSLKALPPRPFSFTEEHCTSVAASALELAVFPSIIDWDEPELQNYSYGYQARLIENGDYPWNYLLLGLALGTMMEGKETGKYYISPTVFEKEYKEFKIYNPDGTSVPLITGQPVVLLPETGDHSAHRPTPLEAALLILAISAIITIIQYSGKVTLVGQIWDWILWIFITAGGLFLAFITFGPIQYGSGWNWVLLIWNPVAWIPVVVFRKNRNILKSVWLVYTAVLVLFAAFISHLAPSLDPAWRLFAIALAFRSFAAFQRYL